LLARVEVEVQGTGAGGVGATGKVVDTRLATVTEGCVVLLLQHSASYMPENTWQTTNTMH
jgi:hypothetical protein